MASILQEKLPDAPAIDRRSGDLVALRWRIEAVKKSLQVEYARVNREALHFAASEIQAGIAHIQQTAVLQCAQQIDDYGLVLTHLFDALDALSQALRAWAVEDKDQAFQYVSDAHSACELALASW